MNDYIIKIEPQTSHISQRILFTIKNLPAHCPVKISAVSKNYYCINSDIRNTPDDAFWTSSAEFYTDENGTLDLSETSPTKGSYEKADEMGLIYSMTAKMSRNKYLSKFLKDVDENRSYRIDLTFTINDKKITRSITRYFCNDEILCRNVNNALLKGRFFIKNDNKEHPAVIVLSGSDGRIEKAQAIAECLAMEGFAALAVCYFGMNGVSPSLEKIPLEIVKESIEFLKADKNVDKNKIGIYGRSKGGEMALETASLYRDITCTAVTSPSCITYAGLTEKSLNSKHSSWSYQNEELKFQSFKFIDTLSMIVQMIMGRRKALCTLYEKTLNNYDESIIHLEKINGPVLFLSSDEDEIWPSKIYGKITSSYLKSHNFGHKFTQKNYKNAGHMMTLPYQCTACKQQISSSLSDYVYSSVDSWNDTVNFFKKWAGI